MVMSNSTSPRDTCDTSHSNTSHILRAARFSASSLLALLSSLLAYAWLRRRWAKHRLAAIMPTVVWTPRFINYDPFDDDDILRQGKRKMGSSSVTNILPKMERFDGPYGMYATVYGVSARVVHVAHPVPTRAILAGTEATGDCFRGGGFRREKRGFLLEVQDAMLSLIAGLARRSQFLSHTKQDNNSTVTRQQQQQQQPKRRPSAYANTTGSTKTPAYDHFKHFSGDGVFTANGLDWKAKRASVLHCLLGNIHELEAEVNRSSDGLLKELKRMTQEDGRDASDAGAVNAVPLLQRCTIGLIYRLITHDDVSLDTDWDNGDNSNDNNQCTESSSLVSTATTSSPRSSASSLASIGASSTSVMRTGTKSNPNNSSDQPNDSYQTKIQQNNRIRSLLPTYLQSVTQIRMIILAQSRSIWYLLPRWMYRLFSPMYREEERTMVPIREFARLACLNAKRGSPLQLLSQRASHSNGCSSSGDGSISKTMRNGGVSKDLLDEAITLLFAGQDTSAATLSWTLHLLSLDPRKQQRLAEEVRSVLGDETDGSAREMDFVSKSLLSQMPYLDAVIKESMRLYPVAPFVVRRLTSDITIPSETNNLVGDEKKELHKEQATTATATTLGTKAPSSFSGNTTLPSSTFACIWIYALHRNPKLWNLPDDFLPERWIDPSLRKKDIGQEEPGAYIPFAMGPRNCLGRPMAHVILRILLARILRRYTVVDPRYVALEKKVESSSNGGEIDAKCLRKDMQVGFTVLPSNGLMLKFVERDS